MKTAATEKPRTKERTYPVIEIFGPTIQGEGALAGLPTLFVRFGGCDYRCSWCDSMYAVDPAEVRENAIKMTGRQIVERLVHLLDGNAADGMYVTLSGGNPAMMNFDRAPMVYNFLAALSRFGFKVSVETQGSLWRPWLSEVDHLTVSPKPPSSGMLTDGNALRTRDFIANAEHTVEPGRRSLKIVVFDEADLEYARGMFAVCRSAWPLMFLSAGTAQDHLHDEVALHQGISDRYRWLCETVAGDPDFRDVRVLCQLHVVAWGARRGV